MANTIYNIAKANLQNDLLSTDIASGAVYKALLISAATAPDPDHADVAAVLAAAAELSVTGYTAGVGSASRQTVTFTVTQDNANDRSDAVTSVATFNTVGAGTVRQVLIYRHVSGVTESLNIPVMCIDTATGLPLTTNGSNVQVAAQTLRLT